MQTDIKSTNHEIISQPNLVQIEGNAPSSATDAAAMRECIVERVGYAKDDLLRFVIAPDGTVTFDIDTKLPGRGIYVSPSSKTLEEAISKNLFSRAAKQKVLVPEDLKHRVTNIVRHKIFNCLCLANRANEIGAGADQCLDILRSGKAGLYITASDNSSEMRIRIESKNPELPIITYFSDEELGQIIGRPKLTHMIVKKGKLCFKGVHWHQIYNQLK